MKWLDKFIETMSPQWGLKRLQAHRAIQAYYEAGSPSRLHKTRPNDGSADNLVKQAGNALRIQARYLEQNYDIARGALDILVDKTVGMGVRPDPSVRNTSGEPHREFNKELSRLWEDWIRDPEVTGDFDYYSAQRMIARTLYRDGEAFVQLLSGNIRGLTHYTEVPFSFEMLDPDFVPADLDDESEGINQGIKQNKWHRATAYYIFKTHPNDEFIIASKQDTKRVGADNMIHVKCMDRIRQTRGVSVFASVINRFDDIKEIEESERVAARVAAAMAGFIKKGTPDLYVPPADDDDYRGMEFVPGIIFDDLQPGEDVGTIQSNRPNNALIPFRASQLRAASSGIGCGYSSLAKDYDGTYSAQRQELVEQYEHYGVLWQYFANKCCDPIWRAFVRAAIFNGLEIPSDVDKDTLFNVDHSRPVMPWVDPDKEIKGVEGELRNNLISKSQVIRRRGGNPDEVRQQIARDNEEEEELGITQSFDPAEPEVEEGNESEETSENEDEQEEEK